jgi:hypothetical protein
MPKITQSEYAPLKAFFVAWEERFPPSLTLPPEHHPVAVLESFEKTSMSKARLGLGLALNDTLEDSWDFSPSAVAEIDRDFSARGIVTLSELRRRYSRQFRGVLKRGEIKNETEFYLVSGILASFTADASDEERQKLDAMVGAYEDHVAKKGRSA